MAKLPQGQRRRRGQIDQPEEPPVVDQQNVRARFDERDVVDEPMPAFNPPNPVIAPPVTDGERGPTLTEVNPEHGSIIGGAKIWLKGIDFPALFPLFARFGTAVVPTVSLREKRCKPQLTNFLRPSPAVHFLPVICPPQACQVPLMSRYRSTPGQMRRSMEPVSRSSNI